MRGLSVVATCFFLSGLAGLIYQTAWAQQLSVVFGTSEQAVVAVLAAYMAGLALGSALAGKLASHLRRPLLVYGLLELGIGASALVVSSAIAFAGRLQEAWLGGLALAELPGPAITGLFYVTTSFVVLLVPTVCMGATLPLLAGHAVRKDRQIGSRVGLLYAANTAGAAAGCLASAFLLLPYFGLGQTILLAAATNGLVFLLITWQLRAGIGRSSVPAIASPPMRVRNRWILPAMLVSGAVSFSWEVLWTRLLTSLLGSSIYAFALMLASFLVALALGAALAVPWTVSRAAARRGFVIAQIGSALLCLAAFAATEHLPALVAKGLSPLALVPMVLMPGAVAIGMTFPCAVRLLTRRAAETASASGRVFAWNTAGAIAGALLTGFFVLPRLGFDGVAVLAAGLSLTLAGAVALGRVPRWRVPGLLAAAMLAALLAVPVDNSWTLLRFSPLSAQLVPGKLTHFAVGRSSTVMLTEHHGAFRLLTNGLPESAIETAAHRASRYLVARWLSLLPVAARPQTGSVLVVGLGAGITVEEVPASVASIDVLELEAEVVAANRKVAALRRRDPLADPRLRVHLGDARGELQRTGQRWDAIVSQPSHPWTSGSAHLYTREFLALVQRRLQPAGVFVQWMALTFVDEALMRSLAATVSEVFPHAELYKPHPGSVLLLASDRPLDLARTAGRAIELAPREWARAGVLCTEDLLAARWLDHDGMKRLGAGAPPITDSRNLLRMRSPRILGRALSAAGADRLMADLDPLVTRLPVGIDGAYLARRLVQLRAHDRARRLAEELATPGSAHTIEGLIAFAAGQHRAASVAVERALRIDPHSREVQSLRLRLHRATIAAGLPLPFSSDSGDDWRLVMQAWRREAASDWRGVKDLDQGLSSLVPTHPLFAEALRLRVSWRAHLGGPGEAREGLELLSPLLSPLPARSDLLLRARLGIRLGQPIVALAAIEEALAITGSGPSRPFLFQAKSLLQALAVEAADAPWRQDLLRRLPP